MKISRATIALILLLALVAYPLSSWAQQGEVVGVQDGDSITVLHDGKSEKIRLYGVDCPEGRQDFGNRAKEFTSSLIFERVVEVKPITMDRYERTVAMVYSGNKCVSEELIRSGFGWVFTRYCHESLCGEWRRLEEQARKSKLGLWAGPNPIPPWEYRGYKKQKLEHFQDVTTLEGIEFPTAFTHH